MSQCSFVIRARKVPRQKRHPEHQTSGPVKFHWSEATKLPHSWAGKEFAGRVCASSQRSQVPGMRQQSREPAVGLAPRLQLFCSFCPLAQDLNSRNGRL